LSFSNSGPTTLMPMMFYFMLAPPFWIRFEWSTTTPRHGFIPCKFRRG
jgi:hypothetical protein